MKGQFQIFLLTIIILMMLPLNKKPFMKMAKSPNYDDLETYGSFNLKEQRTTKSF